MRKRLVGLLSIALLAGAGSARATSGPETDGLRAYVAGRFDEAAVGLKQSVRAGAGDGAKRTGSAVSGRTAYFLARSFEELGLRGLALHYLGQAELYGSPEWQLLARRELARAYFEVTDYPAVMEVVDRMKGQPADAEICYFAGLAAAELRAWPEAIEMLGRVPAASAYASYAVYARAQAKAASGDFAGALADLDRVISRVERDPAGVRRISFAFWKSAEHPDALLEQARVLRGKILYVDGRDGEARSSFAAVGGGGGSGLEAMRGLLLTGAGMESAAKVEVSPSRPVDATALMTVQALAAEEREDDDTARRIRSRVQSMVRDRLFVLEGSQGAAERSLEQDVSAFWSRLRRARWSQRWQDEADALGDVAGSLGRPAAAPSDPFRPQDGLFYGVWDQARTNAWLHGLVELRASAEELASDLAAAPQRGSFWKFWRSDDDLRFADALLVIRVVNVSQRLADHLHNFDRLGDDEYRPSKRRAAEAGVGHLQRLYVGTSAKVPPDLVNLVTALEYKRFDIVRLVDAVPERATDPDVSLLGNYVDLLADLRARLAQAGESVPKASAVAPDVLRELGKANEELIHAISEQIRQAVEPTRRAQLAFFTRVEADNERALSRLYGRLGGDPRRAAATPAGDDRAAGAGKEAK